MALSFLASLGLIAAQAIVSKAMAPDDPGQQQQMAGSLYQPLQMPQQQPPQQMGLPQPPDYQTPPAIGQFPPFQPLFGQGRNQ